VLPKKLKIKIFSSTCPFHHLPAAYTRLQWLLRFFLPPICPQNIKPYPKITQLPMTWNKVSFHFQKRGLIKWGPLFQKNNQKPCDIEGFSEDFGDHVLVTGRDSALCKLCLSFSVSSFNCSFKCMWPHIEHHEPYPHSFGSSRRPLLRPDTI
jgi:hypothetical protein